MLVMRSVSVLILTKAPTSESRISGDAVFNRALIAGTADCAKGPRLPRSFAAVLTR